MLLFTGPSLSLAACPSPVLRTRPLMLSAEWGVWTRWSSLVALVLSVSAWCSCVGALNDDCTLLVPLLALTPAGMATPFQLTATVAADGPCHQSNTDQQAFVQGAILNTVTAHARVHSLPAWLRSATRCAWPERRIRIFAGIFVFVYVLVCRVHCRWSRAELGAGG